MLDVGILMRYHKHQHHFHRTLLKIQRKWWLSRMLLLLPLPKNKESYYGKRLLMHLGLRCGAIDGPMGRISGWGHFRRCWALIWSDVTDLDPCLESKTLYGLDIGPVFQPLWNVYSQINICMYKYYIREVLGTFHHGWEPPQEQIWHSSGYVDYFEALKKHFLLLMVFCMQRGRSYVGPGWAYNQAFMHP